MTEKLSHEPLPTPERNIKERLLAAAKEVARLGAVAFGLNESDKRAVDAFHEVGRDYRVFLDTSEDAEIPVLIALTERLESGLHRHHRFEFLADGTARHFEADEGEADYRAFLDFVQKTDEAGGDMQQIERIARTINAGKRQRVDQDEAMQRDTGFAEIGDETELADLLHALEGRLAVLRRRAQRHKETS